MHTRFLLLALLFVAVGCSDDAAPSVETTVSADDDVEVRRLEAEARIAEARAREAEAMASGDDELEASTEIDAAPAAPSAPAAAPTPPAAPSRPSGGTAGSTRPGTTGLPPSRNAPDLFSGSKEFRFCETTRQSAIDRYVGMELCYEGTVRQEGNKLVGSGRKTTENGSRLRGAARTPLRIEGYVYDDYTVRFNYTVEGERRVTRGSASLDGDAMNSSGEGVGWPGGTFQTDAAQSSGESFFFISNPVG